MISARDLGVVFGLPFLFLAAWLTPERWQSPLARAVAPHAGSIFSRRPSEVIDCICAFLGDRCPTMPAPSIARQLVAEEIERNFMTARDLLPIRWRPRVRLEGGQGIREALEGGQGVILWDSHFFHANLLTKVALKGAGFEVHHLSHPRHGFTDTRFGMRFLNPIRVRSELHYLKERVTLSRDGPVGAMRTLKKRLGDNRVVSISVMDTGKKPCSADFLDGVIRIATGAPDLAYACGSPLIPLFTVRTEDGGYLTTAEAPIEIRRELTRQEASAAAVREYAARLETHVIEYPGQWVDWINLSY